MPNPNSFPSAKPPIQHVSSRLVKKEQKKLGQQTLIFAGVGIVVLLLFIFVIMPNAIRIFFNFLDKGTVLENKDEMPPQPPILQSPVVATFSATLNLTGVAEPKSEVVFVVNGSKEATVKADEAGRFEYEFTLIDQTMNELSLFSIDEAGNESLKTKIYKIQHDSEPPKIELEKPTAGASIELESNRLTEIKGKTEAGSKVYINDKLIYARSDGTFKTTYQLQEGENKLHFKVIDKAGNITEEEITVNFKL